MVIGVPCIEETASKLLEVSDKARGARGSAMKATRSSPRRKPQLLRRAVGKRAGGKA
jgi:hypothetical protein